MPSLWIHRLNADEIKLNDPDVATLNSWFERLDGEVTLSMTIMHDSGHLFIESSREDRVHVFFSNATDKAGHLLDTDLSDNQKEVQFQLSNGQVDSHPIRMTVPKSKAIEIASHFFSTNEFPAGLQWDGKVSK